MALLLCLEEASDLSPGANITVPRVSLSVATNSQEDPLFSWRIVKVCNTRSLCPAEWPLEYPTAAGAGSCLLVRISQ